MKRGHKYNTASSHSENKFGNVEDIIVAVAGIDGMNGTVPPQWAPNFISGLRYTPDASAPSPTAPFPLPARHDPLSLSS